MKVAIVCGSPSSEFLAPFDDATWEIWVLGNRIDRFKNKRVTRIFEIHDDLTEHGDPERYAQYLVDFNVPMIVGEKFPIDDNWVKRFDFDKSKALYGSLYLTSSSAYMMSQAISDGAKQIGIYGVDMAVDSFEYYWQRPCMEAWIGFAKGLGIKVHIPDVSPIGKHEYIEGRGCGGKPTFERPPFTQNEFTIMAKEHIKHIQAIDSQIEALKQKMAAHDGAKQVYEKLSEVARATESGNIIKSLSQTHVIKG